MKTLLMNLLANRLFSRYLLVSIIALASDMLIFLICNRSGLSGIWSATAGYSVGLAVHWLLSSRVVFDNIARSGSDRTLQKLLFILSALAGLALTAAIIRGSELLGYDAVFGKILAIPASFLLTYALRKYIVFAASGHYGLISSLLRKG